MPEEKKSDKSSSPKRSRRTVKPAGSRVRRRDAPIFVIQKHDARSLHYDFRLEIGGVLQSWAVPKGPTINPKEMRLAIMVEEHPMEYADFEGVIPEGDYGAGTVMVWDKGTYTNISKKDGVEVPIEKSLEDGHIIVRLEGTKLKGGYALIRTKSGRPGGGKQWLLVKKKDDRADARRNPLISQPNSALTGRTMAEIAKQG
jgi:DNA ligase D-like protein (predicted 3'-phosphoesterase)